MLTLLGSSARYKAVLAYSTYSHQWCISESLLWYKANVHETYLKNILKVKKNNILLVIFNFFFLIVLWIFWVVSETLCMQREIWREFFFFFNDKFMSLCRIRIDNERNQVCNCTYTVRLCDIIISQILHTHCTNWWNVKFLHIHDTVHFFFSKNIKQWRGDEKRQMMNFFLCR